MDKKINAEFEYPEEAERAIYLIKNAVPLVKASLDVQYSSKNMPDYKIVPMNMPSQSMGGMTGMPGIFTPQSEYDDRVTTKNAAISIKCDKEKAHTVRSIIMQCGGEII